MKWIRAAIGMLGLGAAAFSTAQATYCSIPANSFLYCPADKKVYATVDSSGPKDLANTVSRIDPKTGKIEASVQVGADPGGLVQSDNGEFLYLMMDGNATVLRIARAGLTPDVPIPIGTGFSNGRIMPVPKSPRAIFVDRNHFDVSPTEDTFRIYTDGKPSPATAPGPDKVALYNRSLQPGGYGLCVSDDGSVIDLETRQPVGRLPDGGSEICVDPVRPVAYQVYEDRVPMIRAYDLQTYRRLWSRPLPSDDGGHHPRMPIRWGDDGIAWRDDRGIAVASFDLGPLPPKVDLAVERSPFPSDAKKGQTLSYTLTVKNLSGNDSTGAILTDTLPAGVTVQSVTASQGSGKASDAVVCADLGPIRANRSATVQVTIKLGDVHPDGFVAAVRSFDPGTNTKQRSIYYAGGLKPSAAVADAQAASPFKMAWLSAKLMNNRAATGQLVVTNTGKIQTKPTSIRLFATIPEDEEGLSETIIQFGEVQVASLRPGQSMVVTPTTPMTFDPYVGLLLSALLDRTKINGPSVSAIIRIPGYGPYG